MQSFAILFKAIGTRFTTSWLSYLLLGLWVILGHASLLPIATALTNSDFAWISLEADRFLQGEGSAFYEGQSYGGTTLTFFRALWCWLVERLSSQGPQSYVWAQMTFSYLLTPILMAWSTFFLATRYCSRGSAHLVGLIAATGFLFWVHYYGNDFYFAAYALGCLLLAWRADLERPWISAPPQLLFLSGLAAGLAIYTWRGSLIYVAAFFLDRESIRSVWSALRFPKGLFQRVLVILIFFLTGLFAYLEFFGGDLGVLLGKRIKLHGTPNLVYAGFLLVLLLALRFRTQIFSRPFLQRAAILAAGFFMGLLPELAHTGFRPGAGAGGSVSLPDMLRVGAQIPSSFRALVGGGDSLLRQFSVLLFLGATVSLVMEARKRPRVFPLVLVLLLGVIAFCRVMTYTVGTPRYLFPLFPVWLVAVGLWMDGATSRKLKVLILILIAGHLLHQRQSIKALASDPAKVELAQLMKEVGTTFQNAGIRVVLTDNYWESNQFTLASGKKVFFVPIQGLAPRISHKALQKSTEPVIGVLSPAPSKLLQTRRLHWNQQDLNLVHLGKVGHLELFSGSVR